MRMEYALEMHQNTQSNPVPNIQTTRTDLREQPSTNKDEDSYPMQWLSSQCRRCKLRWSRHSSLQQAVYLQEKVCCMDQKRDYSVSKSELLGRGWRRRPADQKMAPGMV
ncbi:hypothetical protein BaRGS_00003807 [Batillaria attramentaria]|uniref:Uncharacterized protein n=1 Tax=Batillaria attramentaria TaxID=370345 RepID=A0ABD0LZ99_9CAEN